MPLNSSTLKTQLAQSWMVPDGGQYPSSAFESADQFAAAVSSWFAAATSMGIPCATAQVRRPQLSSQAAVALQAKNPAAAGQLLALAVASYIAGQAFGPGIASFPPGVLPAQVVFGAVFSDLESSVDARATRMTQVCTAMAMTTPVIFPPGSPSPIL